MIRIKRVYDKPGQEDGPRFLVDRLWPRGVKKADLYLEAWLRELAPSTGLRQWFGHDPVKWPEFCRRYHAELAGNVEAWQPLLEMVQERDITLLFSANDLERNNAVALRLFLEERLYTGT